MSGVVAVVAAKDRGDRVEATVAALAGLDGVDRVVVVDDGSTDDTAGRARAAGATVVRLDANVGKGGAVAAGVAAAPDADVYLLVDADVGTTAAAAAPLLGPVVRGDADMTIGVLPAAGRRGGFGSVRRLAGAGIRRACGFEARAPLSGQRAVRGDLLRSLETADRFGLETAMTIDAVRAGARVVEVDVAMDHRHTGRRVAGFRHRAGQAVDVVRALWPRLTSSRGRLALTGAAFAAAAALALGLAGRAEASSVPATRGANQVVVFGFSRLDVGDLVAHRAELPTLTRLRRDGAVAAMSVRTLSGRPSTTEGYATLGAGARVRADDQGGYAFDAPATLEGGTAAQALERRTGRDVEGEVVVVGAPAVHRDNRGRHLSSEPGALGTALAAAGLRTAVIGNADTGYRLGPRSSLLRPGAIALMREDGAVDRGKVGRDLLRADPGSPFGYRADRGAVLGELDRSLAEADVVLVDAGDMDRAAEFADVAEPAVAARARVAAMRATDELLAEVVERLPDDALLLVASVAPATREWRLTPVVAHGAGVAGAGGYLHSPSTRRVGVVTLTDLAPTILDAVGAPVPDGMIGHALRYRPGDGDLAHLVETDRDAAHRERIYLPLTMTFIVLQAVVYLLAIVAFGRLGGVSRRPGLALRFVVLAIAAYPLSTFLVRAIPDVAALGAASVLVLLAVDVGVAAASLLARRHALSPLAWILAATVGLLCVDVATGARLQTSSLLGYSLHTAARFTGLGNTAFATLAATTILVAAIHVHYSPRRREALVSVALLFAFVVMVDGAPSLGSDVGGILTLVPVFGLTLLVLTGRRLSPRAIGAAAAVTVVALLLATGIDLLRPSASRTHLGRLVADVQRDGLEVFRTTAARKIAANFRTYGSPWSWTVVIIALYMLYVLGWTRGWRELLAPRSALRAGVVGTLAAGLLGYAVNDSGVVVTAVVFVYLGPFLTLLALQPKGVR